MNNDSTFSIIGDEPVEARIVAWVLGEASAFEAQELERLCSERPELLVFKRRMRALHGLLTESEAAQPDEGWKLPPEKRKSLNEISGESAKLPDPAVEKRIRYSARRALLAIAACLILTVIIAGLTAPAVMSQRKMASKATSIRGMLVDRRERESIVPLRTEVPREMIEGTPKPINVPDFEAPVNGPAGSGSWASGGELLAKGEIFRSAETPVRPPSARPAEPLPAAPPPPATTPAPAADQMAKSKLNADPFSDDDAESSRRDKGRESGRKVDSTPGKQDMPVLGARLSGEDRHELGDNSRLAGGYDLTKSGAGTLNFSGTNTYSGSNRLGTVVSGAALGLGGEASKAPDGPNQKPSDAGVAWEENVENQKALLSNRAPDGSESDAPARSRGPRPKVAPPAKSESAGRTARATTLDQPADTSGDINGVSTVTDANQPGASAGWGGALDSNGRRRDEVAEADLKKHLTGFTGSTKTLGGTLDMSIRAGAERKPSDLDIDYFVADENTKTGVREDVSKVDGRVPTLDEIPALGALFSGKKGNAAPAPGQRNGDGQLAEGDFDGTVNYGAPVAGEKDSGSGLAEREITRRQSAVQDGDRLLMEGRDAYQKGDFQRARYKYSESLAKLPDAPVLSDRKDSVEKHLSDASTALAMQARKVGKYSEANELLKDALEKNPDNSAAKAELSYLEDPIRTNPALTYEHSENVDKVRRNLYMAEGNMNLGKFDAAKKGYEDTLRIDPNNASARKGMEKLAAAKSQYYRAAYDHTRAELLAQVDDSWELAVPADGKDEKAGLDVIREFVVPTEYEPPQIPAKPDLAKLMEEISASDDPYSTFSLNISDASFKIAQAALAKGERPDPAGVKVEQFYNAVDYGDPSPTDATPVALASERCAHPVIPGRDLVRVAVKTAAAGRSAAQPLRLTLLVDQSGSMVRVDRREAMAKALSSLAGLLTANDRVTLIGFSRTPHLLADGIAGDQAVKLPGMIHQESAEGGTNLEEAIKLAGQLAARHKQQGAQNRIVLFTDGAANLGDADPARLAERVKALRQGGFAFDIAGIAADDINDELLGELARNGNGRYYIVGKGDDGQFAERLAGAFRPAAENVKVQVRFNPERVARYKLIGFEKDRLKTEDFRNDSVDAAEMAAEEAGVAIYQVETLPGGSGELGEVSVRFRDAVSDTMVERSLVLPHSGPAPAIDRASPPMQLAVLAMLAAEKLKGGPLGGAVDFTNLNGPRGNVRAFFGPGSRAAEMLQVIDRIQ